MEFSLKQSINLVQKIRTSYNKRNVRYEDIHNLDSTTMSEYISMLKIENNFNILDHGCGYGAVSNEICKMFPDDTLNFSLQDISNYQIERAKKELNWVGDNKSFEFYVKKLKLCNFDNDYFDIAFSKLVLQEMPLNEQTEEIIELKRIVKKDGHVMLWLLWPGIESAPIFRDIIREKDKIAKLTTLVKCRHFTDPIEFNNILTDAGIDISSDVEFSISHPLIYESQKQLTGDFKNDFSDLMKFNEYIRQRAKKEPTKILKKLNYKDIDNNVSIQIPQMIIKIKNNKL